MDVERSTTLSKPVYSSINEGFSLALERMTEKKKVADSIRIRVEAVLDSITDMSLCDFQIFLQLLPDMFYAVKNMRE